MLTFKAEMDAHSLTLERDGKRIGFLHWHPERAPRVVLWAGPGASNELTIEEMDQVTRRYREDRAAREQNRVTAGTRFVVGVTVYVTVSRVGPSSTYWTAKEEATGAAAGAEYPEAYINANRALPPPAAYQLPAAPPRPITAGMRFRSGGEVYVTRRRDGRSGKWWAQQERSFAENCFAEEFIRNNLIGGGKADGRLPQTHHDGRQRALRRGAGGAPARAPPAGRGRPQGRRDLDHGRRRGRGEPGGRPCRVFPPRLGGAA